MIDLLDRIPEEEQEDYIENLKKISREKREIEKGEHETIRNNYETNG